MKREITSKFFEDFLSSYIRIFILVDIFKAQELYEINIEDVTLKNYIQEAAKGIFHQHFRTSLLNILNTSFRHQRHP
jgi:uncharacterized membrane protein